MKAVPETSSTLFKYSLLESQIIRRFGTVAAFEKAVGLQIAPFLNGECPDLPMRDVSKISIALSLSETEESAFFFGEIFFGHLREEDSREITEKYESLTGGNPPENPNHMTVEDNDMNELKVIDLRVVLNTIVRIYGDFENPLFLAKDVATWIEHSNSRAMLEPVDEHEKIKRKHPVNNPYGGYQEEEQWFLTEDGLYEVLMLSRKPIAKQFKAAVKEVLRSLRKHGGYLTPTKIEEVLSDPDTIIRLATDLKAEREKRKELEVTNQTLLEENEAERSAKERLQIETDRSKEWLSIKRVARLNGLTYRDLNWKKLAEASLLLKLPIPKIPDVNYGAVNAYNIRAFLLVYPHLRYK